MLYLIATPIGNLDDFSARAVTTLKNSQLICCEDTRHSSTLLRHYGIEAPLLPYHKFNEKKFLDELLDRLRLGQSVSLISDAGTPCINDPGRILVQACIEHNIPFTAIPGPCSPIVALTLSGFDPEPFQYVGFLPKESDRGLKKILYYSGTTIALESPSRIIDTVTILKTLSPQRKIAVAREMTKLHEEVLRGVPEDLLSHFAKHPPRGEMVLIVGPGSMPLEELPLDELIELLQGLHGCSLKEAIQSAAKLTKRPKRDVYREVHQRIDILHNHNPLPVPLPN
jgi:16S rRNA (cytidine1402-2'-O)-methyltransferase